MNGSFGLRTVFTAWLMLLTGACMAVEAGAMQAAAFHMGENIYVSEPAAAVRKLPGERAAVIASLPMGMAVQYQGAWGSHSPYCNENGADADAVKAGWACISTYVIPGEGELPFYGWMAAAAFTAEPPRLDALLAEYDRTPAAETVLRRQLAERAIALAPYSQEAQSRLLEALAASGDRAAIAAAQKSFAAWQAHQPAVAEGDSRAIYSWDGYSIGRFASLVNGEFRRGDIGAAVRRGQFYYVYAGGRKVGTVATIMQFNCTPPDCPSKVPAAAINLSALSANQPAYAANFVLHEGGKPAPAITAKQKAILTGMMKAEIKAVPAKATRDALLTALNVSRSWASTAQFDKDGRLLLIGQLVVGGVSTGSKGGAEPLLASLLVIAEQQGGRFKKAAIAASALGDCYASDAEDFDGDGTDEIVLTCRPTGPYYNYGLLKRVNGRWVRQF